MRVRGLVLAAVGCGALWLSARGLRAAAHASEDLAGLLAEAGPMAEAVARLRGLSLEGKPVALGSESRAELRERVVRRVERGASAARRAGEELALKRLGLLPADVNLDALRVDLPARNIKGYYDPERKRLMVIDDLETAADTRDARLVLAHEIAHALQDRHFAMAPFYVSSTDNSDAALARAALMEGDAVAVMLEYSFDREGGLLPWGDRDATAQLEQRLSLDASRALGDAPDYVRSTIMFPYLHGLRFVLAFRRHHPWSRIDRMFASPPLSTEHIIHPEVYAAYERPVAVEAGSGGVLPKYSMIHSDVLGEWGMANWFRLHGLSEAAASLAADGWAGDRWAAYSSASGELADVVVVSYSVWDQLADASEFFDGAVVALAQITGREPDTAGGSAEASRAASYEQAGDRRCSVRQSSDRVLVIIGAPAGTELEIARYVEHRWRIKR